MIFSSPALTRRVARAASMHSRRCNSTPVALSSLINRAAAFVRRPVDHRITRQRHRTSLSPRPARHNFFRRLFCNTAHYFTSTRIEGKISPSSFISSYLLWLYGTDSSKRFHQGISGGGEAAGCTLVVACHRLRTRCGWRRHGALPPFCLHNHSS